MTRARDTNSLFLTNDDAIPACLDTFRRLCRCTASLIRHVQASHPLARPAAALIEGVHSRHMEMEEGIFSKVDGTCTLSHASTPLETPQYTPSSPKRVGPPTSGINSTPSGLTTVGGSSLGGTSTPFSMDQDPCTPASIQSSLLHSFDYSKPLPALANRFSGTMEMPTGESFYTLGHYGATSTNSAMRRLASEPVNLPFENRPSNKYV